MSDIQVFGSMAELPNPVQRADANETVFINEQLGLLDPQIYEEKYAPLDADILCPVSMDKGLKPYHDWYQWEESRGSGEAKAHQDSGTDIAVVNEASETRFTRVHTAVVGYRISEKDLMAAADFSRPLSARLDRRCMRALLEYRNKSVLEGRAKYKLKGFFKNADISIFPALSQITVASAPADDLATLNNLANRIAQATRTGELANKFCLPLSTFLIINDKARSSTSDTTVLEYWAANNRFVRAAGGVSAVHPLTSFDDDLLGDGSKVAVALDFDAENVESLVIPPARFKVIPQLWGMLVVYTMTFTDVLYRYPKAVTIIKGL